MSGASLCFYFCQEYGNRPPAFAKDEEVEKIEEMEKLHGLEHEKMIFVRLLRKKLLERGKFDGSLLQLMDFYDVKETEFSPNAIFLGTGVKKGEPKLNPPEKKSSRRSSAAKKGIPAAKLRKTTKSRDSSASAAGVENENDQGVQDEEDVLLPPQATRSTPQVTKDQASPPGRVKKGRKKKKMDQPQVIGASTDHSSVNRAKRHRPASQNDDFEYY
jgi:hypothetical protein